MAEARRPPRISFARRSRSSALPAVLALSVACSLPAAAAPHLLGVRGNQVFTVELAGAAPVVQGPFLAAGITNQVTEIVALPDEAAALVLTAAKLYRLDLADPLAPAIATSIDLPFATADLVPASLRGYSLLVGTTGGIVSVDNTSLALGTPFATGSGRVGGALTADGRTLATFATSAPFVRVSSFDPQAGLGTVTSCTASFGSPAYSWGFFSPDGKTLAYVQNSFFFRPAPATEGIPPQHIPFIDTYSITGNTCSHADAEDPDLDAVAFHGFSRSGAELFFVQGANEELEVENRLLRYGVNAGVLTENAPLTLTTGGLGFGSLARTAGGKAIYLSTADEDGNELHRYRPATGSLETFAASQHFDHLAAFDTGAAVFADGFESGNTTSWDAVFP